jgi:uncharacterized repeat protein (TIGR04138 family)
MIDKDQVILDIVREDARYAAEAYHFVFESLDYTIRRRGGGRKHVSGPEILEGMRLLALDTFGYLARSVLESWGVRSTDDFGEVVFRLIRVDLLQKTADDRKEDFSAIFDFSAAFDNAFEATLQSVEL